MSTWAAILAVGLGSYLFRLLPLVLMGHRGRTTVSAPLDRTIRHASAAALTALVVSSLVHGSGSGQPLALWGAAAGGLAVALRGATMLRVVVLGMAVYAVLTATGALVG
jgi:branched-subunit amino acid transport protein